MALSATEFEMFMNQAWVKLPGASDAGIKLELFDTIKEFLDVTSAWTENINFSATINVTNYTIVPTEGQMIRLVGVWDPSTNGRIFKAATLEDFSTVVLQYPPESTPAYQWFARVIKNIILPRTSQGVPIAPSWLLTVYGVPLLDGLLGRMMAQQDKTYSNDKDSAYHLRRFRKAMQATRIATMRLHTVGDQEFVYPRAWPSSAQFADDRTAWATEDGDRNGPPVGGAVPNVPGGSNGQS